MKVARAGSGDGKTVADGSWSKAVSPMTFPVDRVDVWKVDLDKASPKNADVSVSSSSQLSSNQLSANRPSSNQISLDQLSADEAARARRFHFEKDRMHYVRCRSALRSLLSGYLAIPGSEICFEYSASGKPRLSAGQNPRGLQFNVSHSGGLALIALGSERRLGVDIEKIRRDVDVSALAERFFSQRERAALRALPDELRVAAFYACWTRKESFLKATGDGLSFPLADFSVTTHPDLDPVIEEIRGDGEAGKGWFLANLPAIDGYGAAVALDVSSHQISSCEVATYEWT